MTTTRCISSHAMSILLTWRNPQGREENWFHGGHQGVPHVWKHIGKLIVTEVGLAALTVTAIAETVVYTACKVVALPIHFFTDRPYKFCSSLLESSSFTILWGAADAIFYNIFVVNVLTREPFARYWADKFNRTAIILYRLEDRQEVAHWSQQARGNIQNELLGPILAEGRATNEAIDQGAALIAQEILSCLIEEDLPLFQESDPSLYWFIITKAIFIYTLGSKETEAIPNFFKSKTKTAIISLRQELSANPPSTEEVQGFLTTLKKFEEGSKQEGTQKVFNQLKTIAYGELQQSLFITSCWQKAREQFAAKTPQTLTGDGTATATT